METIQVNLETLVQEAFKKAKQDILKLYGDRYPRDPGISNLDSTATVILKSGKVLPSITFGWQNSKQKRKACFSVAILGLLFDAAAMITVNEVSGFAPSPKQEPFKSIWLQAGGNQEKFIELVQRWRVQRYGPHVWNMPEEYIFDSVVVFGLSPQGNYGLAATFRRKDSPIQFQKMLSGQMEMFHIPRWWEPRFANEAKGFLRIFQEIVDPDFPVEKVIHHYQNAMHKWIAEE